MLALQFEKTMPLSDLTQTYGAAQTRVNASFDPTNEVSALSLNGENMIAGQVGPVGEAAQNDDVYGALKI